jgi:hypothetical protein
MPSPASPDLLAVAGLDAALFATFASHLPGIAPAQTGEALRRNDRPGIR